MRPRDQKAHPTARQYRPLTSQRQDRQSDGVASWRDRRTGRDVPVMLQELLDHGQGRGPEVRGGRQEWRWYVQRLRESRPGRPHLERSQRVQ